MNWNWNPDWKLGIFYFMSNNKLHVIIPHNDYSQTWDTMGYWIEFNTSKGQNYTSRGKNEEILIPQIVPIIPQNVKIIPWNLFFIPWRGHGINGRMRTSLLLLGYWLLGAWNYSLHFLIGWITDLCSFQYFDWFTNLMIG